MIKSFKYFLVLIPLLIHLSVFSQSNSFACNGSGNDEIGGFNLCFGPDDAVVDLDRNSYFSSPAAPQGAKPSEAYSYNFPEIQSVYDCVDGLDVEEVNVIIVINSWSLNFPPALSCCESYISGIFANLYSNCPFGNECDVIGDGLTNDANPGSGDCAASGDQLIYNSTSNTFPLGLPYTSTVSCLSGNFGENQTLGIDIFANFIFEQAAAGGCNNCPQDAISLGYIEIDFNVVYEYIFCSNDLGDDCRSINFDPIGPVCDSDGTVTLPSFSIEGVAGSWSPSNFLDVSASGGTTVSPVFTPSASECSSTPLSIDIVVEECCTAEAGNLQPNNSFSICSDGGEYLDLQLAGQLEPIIPRNFSSENGYHFFLVDANGVIIDNESNLNDIIFPPNTGTTPIDYCIYGLSYKIFPGLGSISNGTTNINFGSPDVLLDGAGNELMATAFVPGSCMELSSNCVTITVEAPNEAPTVSDIDTCEGGDTEIVPSGNGTSFNFYSDEALTTLLSSGSSYDPTPAGGTTTEIWVTEGAGDCQSASSMLTITIVDGADPGMDNTIDLCTNFDSRIDLFDSLEGTPDSNGNWSDDDGTGVDLIDPNNVDISGLTNGAYNFTYTILASDGCPEVSATVTLEIGNPTDAGMNNTLEICSDVASSLDFLNSLNGTPNTGGVWTDLDGSGLDLTDPLDVDISGLVEGNFTFQYEVEGQGSCQDASAVLTIDFETIASAGINGSANICEGGNAIIDLFSSLSGMPDLGGTWSDDNASGVDLSDPSIVDFNGVASGDYTFTYLVEGIICQDQTSEVVVSIGAAPSAGMDGVNSICNDGSSFNLFNELNGVPDNNGTWSDDDASGVDLSNINLVSFDMVPAGEYTFTYSIAASGDCPAASATVTITVEASPNAGSNGALSYCKGTNMLVDLVSELGDDPDIGGTWFDDDNTSVNLSDPTAVDFENVADGNYDFTYQVDGGSFCQNATAVVTIEITSMPNFGSDNALVVCEGDESSFDFYTIINASPNANGTWTDVMSSGIDLSDPSNINLSNLAGGDYTYKYEITGTTNCPGGMAILSIEVEAQGNAGIAGFDSFFCEGEIATVDLFELLTQEDLGGTWTETSGTPSTNAFNPASATFNPEDQMPGSYSFLYTFAAGQVCPESSTQVIITINANPVVNLGSDIDQCVGDGSISLDAGNVGATYNWTVIPDDGNNGASTQNITINSATAAQSNIQVTVTENNCSFTEEIVVTISELPTFEETAKDCSEDLSTYTAILSSPGNTVVSDQGTVINNMDGTFSISSITSGMDATITITDPDTNCEDTFTITAPDCACPTIAPASGSDVTICEGENLPILSATAEAGLEINWYSDASGSNLLLANSNTFNPTMGGTFYVEAFEASSECPSILTPINFIINPLPTFTETDKTCSDDLSTYEVILMVDGVVSTTDAGTIVDDGNGFFTITSISADQDLTVTIESGTTNCTNTFTVTAPDCACPTITPAQATDQSFCEGEDLPTLSATAEAGLEINWYSDASGTNLLLANSNTFTPTMAGTYYAEAFEQSSGCPSDLLEVNLVMNALPTFSETGITCSPDLVTYQVELMTDSDLVDSSLGNVINNGNGSFTIDGILADQNITITIENSLTDCSNIFTVTAPNCECPQIPVPLVTDVAFCSGEEIPTLEAISEIGLPVNWYGDSNGTDLLQVESNIYMPTMAGTFYVQAFDDSNACGSDLVAIILTQNTLPTFNEINKECSADLNTYAITFESDGDVPQTSEGDLVDNMDGTFTISDIPTGAAIMVSIENSLTTCSDAFSVTAPDCACPNFDAPIIETVCDDNGTPDNNLDDIFSYNINLNSIGLGNTFSIQGGDTRAGLDYDTPLGPFGNFLIIDGTVVIQIIDDTNADCTLTNIQIDPPASCSDCQVTVDAGETSELSCAVTETTLQGTASESGQFNWTGPNGFSAIDDANPIVSEAGIYTLTVLFDNGCLETDEVEITIDPTIPTADAGMSQELNCSLTETNLQGTASETGQFNWTGPNGFMVTDEPNPLVTEPGTYTLEVLFTNGCTANDFVEITLDPSVPTADAGITMNITCELPEVTLDGSNSSQGNQYEYSWSGPNGFSSTDQNPQVTVAGTYTLIVTDVVNDCDSEMATVEVLYLREEPVANIVWNENELTCILTEIQLSADLNNPSTVSYIWSFNGITVPDENLTVIQGGNYTLTATDAITGCSSSTSVTVFQNIETPELDVPSFDPITCVNETAIIEITQAQSGQNYTYVWFDAQGNNIAMDSQVTIDNAGQYLVVVTDTVNGCTKGETITVDEDLFEPNADAGDDQELDCNEFTATLNGSSTNGDVTLNWSSDDGTILSGINSTSPEVDAAGTYTLTVTDNGNGCTAISQVTVLEPDTPTDASILIDQPSCINNAGTIIVDGVNGGTTPYLYSIDNGPLSMDASFINLDPNNYSIIIEDANGCMFDTMVVINPSTELTINLGEDQEINFGDSLLINSILNVTEEEITDVSWNTTQTISCDNCLDPYLSPVQSTTYLVEITDENGCVATDEITIIVRRDLNFYIPNAFSPNLDGINDLFTVYPGAGVTQINKLHVLDRWGEVMYLNQNFQADPNIGWDGKHRSELMQAGVYIYVVEVEYVDGTVELFEGDFTLMR